MTGLLVACAIAHFAPTPRPSAPHFEQAMFVALPTGGLVLGFFLAWLATPIKSKDANL